MHNNNSTHHWIAQKKRKRIPPIVQLTRSQLTWPNLYISNHNNHWDEIFLIFILSSTQQLQQQWQIHHQDLAGCVGVTIKCNQISANRKIDGLLISFFALINNDFLLSCSQLPSYFFFFLFVLQKKIKSKSCHSHLSWNNTNFYIFSHCEIHTHKYIVFNSFLNLPSNTILAV